MCCKENPLRFSSSYSRNRSRNKLSGSVTQVITVTLYAVHSPHVYGTNPPFICCRGPSKAHLQGTTQSTPLDWVDDVPVRQTGLSTQSAVQLQQIYLLFQTQGFAGSRGKTKLRPEAEGAELPAVKRMFLLNPACMYSRGQSKVQSPVGGSSQAATDGQSF